MIHREAHSVNAHIAGLCASDTELFASCPHDNTIRVFDAETMRLLRQWRMERPGPMAMDWQGTLWILQLSGDDGCARVMRFNTNGKKLAQEIVLPEGVVPTDICIDRRHRQFVFNNTIFCADAGRRSGNRLDAWTAERLNNWQFKNNIAVTAWSRPRQVHPMERGVPEKMTVSHNLFVNFRNVLEGNFEGELPGLKREGDKPWPFYAPVAETSNVIDRGVDVGLPFRSRAPDLGAFEFGAEPWTLDDIPKPR